MSVPPSDRPWYDNTIRIESQKSNMLKTKATNVWDSQFRNEVNNLIKHAERRGKH